MWRLVLLAVATAAVEYLSICTESVWRPVTRRRSCSWTTRCSQMLTSFYGKLLKVPVDASEIDETDFNSIGCINGIGHQYFYNLTNTVCRSDLILPWILLYYEDRLIGSMWAIAGELSLKDGQQDWFERPNQDFIKKSFPGISTFLSQGAMSIQTFGLHTWFIDNPWDVVCK